MPAAFTRFAPGWRTLGLAVALPASLAVFSPATFAADVVVVTDSRHPVKTAGGERLIELDEAPRIKAELSADLPADPERAAAIVPATTEPRRHRSSAPHRHRLPGRRRCMEPGVAAIPAVVVDQRYVVYGEPDVARAVSRIEQYRRTQP